MKEATAKIVAIVTVCASSLQVQAQEREIDHCAELIRQSRTTSRTVYDRSQFNQTVDNFCREVRSARTDNRSLNLDLRVLGLGQGGGSAASTNSTFTNYCSDERDERRDELNYQLYLEGLAPGAHAAYQACTAAARNGVQFEMLTPPTRDVLELVVFHRTDVPGATAAMSWSASRPVDCYWESLGGDGGRTTPRRLPLGANERTRLKCERDSSNSAPIREPDFVNVIRDGGSATINLPWRKYRQEDDDGPIMTLSEMQDLEEQMGALLNEIRDLEARWRIELDEQTVNFGPAEALDVDQIYQARSSGLVTARVRATGGRMRRGICGWVNAERAPVLQRDYQYGATAQINGGNTNIPNATISMPVRAGEFWTIAQCAGGPANAAVDVLFHPLALTPGGP